ncbi:cadherin-like beta sandwich domain-containing protein [Clostridium sp. C2-6-12]|uniref:cadherin-like beta sandwich domain-containing protein n=1 Tax=Clostridium sp. C2-6-12 TaxID=2698832 RepID=UPI00136C5C6C|nr:cadherin-like beta sandwich domain-containing protein [Clostridium sp. C2-6-12]
MSKNIKNIIAAIFVFSAFSATAPSCLNFTLAKSYAEIKPSLRSIYINKGDNIKFSEDQYSYILDLDKDTDEIYIKARPNNDQDTVNINGKIVTKDDNYKKSVKLQPGKNIVKIEVSDSKKVKTEYIVYVYRGGKEAVYLKDINIDGKTIGFNKSTTSYDLELDENSNIVDLETILDEGNYSVTVNEVELSEKNSIKLKFKAIGKYAVTITVKDEDTDRVGKYTLNIYLGIPVSPNVEEAIKNVIKPNQWILVYGRWRYNDSVGESLKNIWFFDKNYNSYFHFNSRGNMQTGWLEDNEKMYYLSSSGAMQTGWIFDEGSWYFLGTNGVMKTGWIYYDDKWYYLQKNGKMVTNWMLENGKWYYLNSNGAMRTGWIYYGKKWYYLNEDGAMETGWIKIDGEWYCLNSDGSMKSGEWLYYKDNWYYLNYVGNMRRGWLNSEGKYYYFHEDGTLMTTSKIMDGYLYEVNSDGSIKVD